MTTERPDGPTVPAAQVDSGSVNPALVEALVGELSDGAGTDTFGRAEWIDYANAILVHLEIDPDDVFLVVEQDADGAAAGVTIHPRLELFDLNESISAAAEIGAQYLRRVEDYEPAAIDRLDDKRVVRLFLKHTTALPDGLRVGEPID